MRTRKVQGMFEPLTLIVMAALCFAVGGLCILKYGTKEVPMERAAELILHEEGIDINFSKVAQELQGEKEIVP